MKTCKSCNSTLEVSAFYKRNGPTPRYSSSCKECTKQHRKANHVPEKKKDYDLQRAYGITILDYKNMHDSQDGCCKICPKPIRFMSEDKTKAACVDHCHTTGKVRGLLCHSCNRALGLFQDNEAVLLRAAKYLNEANKESDE